MHPDATPASQSRYTPVETRRLPPLPDTVEAIGSHHTLETAIADLVDNSLDAGATAIRVTIVTSHDRVQRLKILDNGHGIHADAMDAAMTLGARRAYGAADLGHFGVGLKAASFSQASTLVIWSAAAEGEPCGRSMQREDFLRDYSCDVLTTDDARLAAARRAAALGSETGTTVVWERLTSVYDGADQAEAGAWLSHFEARLRTHLGVTFHRFIERGRVITTLLVDVDDNEEALPTPVGALDPFGYRTTGRPGYPKVLRRDGADQEASVELHVWPADKDVPGFRLGQRDGNASQGIYVYRHDRILVAGGWGDIATTRTSRQLARIRVEDTPALRSMISINPEKSGVRLEPSFKALLSLGTCDDGTSFDTFLKEAEDTYKRAHRREHKRHPVITPGEGFGEAVYEALEQETGFRVADVLDVQWEELETDDFFAIDFGLGLLRVNARYRSAFGTDAASSGARVVTALLYALTHTIFEGQQTSAKDLDTIALWNAVLTAAVQSGSPGSTALNGSAG